jgi:hypothetical protein
VLGRPNWSEFDWTDRAVSRWRPERGELDLRRLRSAESARSVASRRTDRAGPPRLLRERTAVAANRTIPCRDRWSGPRWRYRTRSCRAARLAQTPGSTSRCSPPRNRTRSPQRRRAQWQRGCKTKRYARRFPGSDGLAIKRGYGACKANNTAEGRPPTGLKWRGVRRVTPNPSIGIDISRPVSRVL